MRIPTDSTLLDNLPFIAMIIEKGTRRIVASNKHAREAGAVPGTTCYATCAQRGDSCPFCLAPEVWADGGSRNRMVEYRGSNYEGIWASLDDDHYLHYIIDNTEAFRTLKALRESEAKLRQAEKMEAIGLLASGIAHDFNNQLGAILGFADMLAAKVKDPKLQRFADGIVIAATRSAELVGQLLAFSRKGHFELRVLDMHATIDEVVRILERTVDKKITIHSDCRALSAAVNGDHALLENAFLNLGINARDALPDGGRITFSTRNTTVQGSEEEAEPGQFLQVRVADTGVGMDEETAKHVFEPFFTTKGPGRGTGLGLASVYGTIERHKGSIEVNTELGKGTTFVMHLPLADSCTEPEADLPDVAEAVRALRVLVVDDDQGVRAMLGCMLTDLGHDVRAFSDGYVAIDDFRSSWEAVDLVILDNVMPRIDGTDTLAAMREINPDVRAVLSSGYRVSDEEEELSEAGFAGFLQKPYSRASLRQVIQAALAN